MDILSPYQIFTILHLLGVATGAGGALASDLIFFHSIRDQKISRSELGFIKLGSKAVWAGLALIVLSGTGLFMLSPEFYLASNKFLAKMSIVGILILNGIVFHAVHIPRFARHLEEDLPSSDEFMRYSNLLMINGAISSTSWIGALVLGALSGLQAPYAAIMSVYLVVVLLAIVAALLGKKFIIHPYRTSR